MAAYLIYLIEGSGRVRQGESLDCRDDAEAIACLEAMERGGEAAELWQGGRRVAQISIDGVVSIGG